MIEFSTETVEQTMAVGAAVGRVAEPGDMVALDGELGAGKTQFIRGLAGGMGIDAADVSSPTFVLMHEYVSDNAARVLVHVDAYRLDGPAALDALGLDDARQDAVLAVEWAERISDALAGDTLWVQLSHASCGRRVTLRATGRWKDRIEALTDLLRAQL